MPVLNDNKEYLGYYDLNEILGAFCLSPVMDDDGVCIEIEKNNNSFSLSEVSQIVESNGGKVLGFYISSQVEDQTQAIIKIATENINETVQTFRRYDYLIISEHKSDFYIQNLKDRSDYLQKYLTM